MDSEVSIKNEPLNLGVANDGKLVLRLLREDVDKVTFDTGSKDVITIMTSSEIGDGNAFFPESELFQKSWHVSVADVENSDDTRLTSHESYVPI